MEVQGKRIVGTYYRDPIITKAQRHKMNPTLADLSPNQEILIPLPSVSLGRRVAYQRIQRDAFYLFGAGGYRMRAEGPAVRVTRLGAVSTERKVSKQLDQANARIRSLVAALRPFAAEGLKWLRSNPVHDDLRLLVGEEWGLMERHSREAIFTVGDLKRAALMLKDQR